MRQDNLKPRDRELAAAIRSSTAGGRQAPGSHPANDEIVAYHRRELAEDAAEALRDHLARCADCARRGLDLAALVEPGCLGDEVAAAGTTADTDAADAADGTWQELQRELRREGLLGEPPLPAAADPGARGTRAGRGVRRAVLDTLAAPWRDLGELFGSLRFAYALAAVFFVTTLTLPWLVADRGSSGPRPNPRLVDLLPVTAAGREADAVPEGRITAGAEDVVLIFATDLGGRSQNVTGRAEVFEGTGPESKLKWSLPGLEAETEGFFKLVIPGPELTVGRYEIRLYADDELVAEYRFRVERPR